MPSFDIIKHTKLTDTFRVKSVIGAFDLDNAKMDEHFKGCIDIEGKEWNVGLIVGGSGTGKTTIAREVFGENIYCGMPHTDNAVIDDMPKGATITEIERMFTSVGFASPPNWLRPYSVLSNGEKMRCDLAYALLQGEELVVYDEFTSVVNRQVAKASSFAISKCVRRNGKKFVAVSCHDDIIEWLQPDWIYNTDTQRFFFAKANTKDRQLNLQYTKLGMQILKGKYGRCSANITI
jgi:ABC-type ATPase with predicted acetyltransferase domain